MLSFVDFITFNASTFAWELVNDPVMGGLSRSNYSINRSTGLAYWEGEVKVVPSLNAPGFCNFETTGFQRFRDASAYSNLIIRMLSTIDYAGWKVSFTADTLSPQFKSFKADFNVTADGQWHEYALPWNAFSNDWSAYTGEPVTPCSPAHPEVCPTLKNLQDISAFGLWTEGAAGPFNVQIQWVRAGNLTEVVAEVAASARATGDISLEPAGPLRYRSSCSGPIQSHLRYNCSNRSASYLPVPPPASETQADAICCDPIYAKFAEPSQFFAQLDVAMFLKVNFTGVTTFYDSVCGLALFQAPINRTFAEWRAESHEHGWPSFRPAEVVAGNVKVDNKTGYVYSTCGTKLGSNLPDTQGDRYCLDLSCIAGNPH